MNTLSMLLAVAGIVGSITALTVYLGLTGGDVPTIALMSGVAAAMMVIAIGRG